MGARLDTSQLAALGVRLTAAGPAVVVAERSARARTAYAIEGTAKVLCAVDTGATVNSIGTDIDDDSAEIGPTTEYAPFLELGTSRMAGQPFMAPAFDRHVPEYVHALSQIATAAF